MHTNGTTRFRHHIVGELTLAWEGMELGADPGQAFIAFTAEPGSASAEALGFLASWASTAQSSTTQETPAEADRR